MLLVQATGMDLSPLPELSGEYVAPDGTGDLTITSYDGNNLTIASSDGETFHFDAETRAFTDANGTPVPTDTPAPTLPLAPTPNGTFPFPFPTDEPTPTPPATSQPTVAATAAAGLGG